MFMTIQDALDIVLDLARQNALDLDSALGEEQYQEAQRQKVAINTVEDFYANHLGDD